MKKNNLVIIISFLMVLSLTTVVSAGFFDWLTGGNNGEFKYYSPNKLKQSIEEDESLFLVDIQAKADFDKHHIQGAIATYAYPVKSEEDKAKLDKILAKLKGSNDDIVIVCPRGGGGAERTYNYLLSKDIKEERLYILEDGQAGWPYKKLLAQRDYSSYKDSGFIIGPNYLVNNLENDKLLILDARGDKAYNNGHIPGAIAVSWQEFSDMNGAPGDKNWGVLLDVANLSKKLSSIGVDEDKTVVVYADTKNSWGEEGRLVWMLRLAGIKNTKILDGGFNYWKNNDYQISKDNVKPKYSNFKVKNLNQAWTINTNKLKNGLTNIKVLDSRAKVEYDGATKFGEARGGHIPDAISLPYKSLLNQDGTLKSAKKLEALFKEAGLKKDDQIVSYCTAGIRSAYLTIVLRMMGYNNAKNYDQSFYRWANLKGLKLEK